MTIRFATLADVPAILAIYAPYITDSVISFEYEVPTLAEFSERVRVIQTQFPYLVAELDGRVLGYAYASKHRDRTAYQWSVETSVYVHPDGHRQGIARQLYTTLLTYLRRQGYINAFAGITSPNPSSEAFHRAMAFTHIGTYSNIGYKMGSWHSVSWFQLALQAHKVDPPVPLSIGQLT
ncbi:GNAT family N-acetyltransferase [Spirosoma radiotolerans]|uniref:Phosphinothricin acetyltransferase n=1 Tax=Spirosoma radiotolerans TaxID=1379870 RepID=A0A0E3ZXI7_9BACT|nr:GNAT family N-acetyltransferase [Spirosoma radiotolerans]AKD56443.1 phosphinothricin acetyltransferase [Spirosoma radiotolerans]